MGDLGLILWHVLLVQEVSFSIKQVLTHSDIIYPLNRHQKLNYTVCLVGQNEGREKAHLYCRMA